MQEMPLCWMKKGPLKTPLAYEYQAKMHVCTLANQLSIYFFCMRRILPSEKKAIWPLLLAVPSTSTGGLDWTVVERGGRRSLVRGGLSQRIEILAPRLS